MENTQTDNMLVLLYYRPLGIVRGRTIAISEHDVFVDTNFVCLNPGEEIDIAILYPNGLIRRLSTTILSSNKFGTTLGFNTQQQHLPGTDHYSAMQFA